MNNTSLQEIFGLINSIEDLYRLLTEEDENFFSLELEQDYSNRKCSTCSLGQSGTCELNLEDECCTASGDEENHVDYWISCLDDESDSIVYKLKNNENEC